MTPGEFKAWFDGFTEGLSGPPTKAKWERIKERVAEIDGKTVTEYRYYRDYWLYYWAQNNTFPATFTGTTCGSSIGQPNAIYCSNTAMYSLGRAEATAVDV